MTNNNDLQPKSQRYNHTLLKNQLQIQMNEVLKFALSKKYLSHHSQFWIIFVVILSTPKTMHT